MVLKLHKRYCKFYVFVCLYGNLCTFTVSEHIGFLYNEAIAQWKSQTPTVTTGTVPEQFKIAKVIPVFKTGSQTCVNNYRPISLLSIFNKLLEKLMYKRLLNYINDKNILHNKQFGFRMQYSTDFAIMSIVDLIQRAIDNQKYSCGIFLDYNPGQKSLAHLVEIA